MTDLKQEDSTDNNSTKELVFEDVELQAVAIGDDDIEADDREKALAKKRAKKFAKIQKHRTPEERRRARYKKIIIACLVVLTIFIIISIIPVTRWYMLNTIGFRNSVTVTVVQEKSQKPIANATVVLDGQEYPTDEFGSTTLKQVRYGNIPITVSKPGYSRLKTRIYSDIGVRTAGVLRLKVIGVKLDIAVKHWLSGKPMAGVAVAAGQIKAKTDRSGLANLIVAPTDSSEREITVSAKGYNSRTIKVPVNVTSRDITMVARAKNYFMSNRDGDFDIFSSNIDGSNQKKIIEATGKENKHLMQFTVDRSNKYAVLVATRDGTQRNNRIVAGIYRVDLEKATLSKLDEGSDVAIVGWVGDSLVYQKTNPDLDYDHSALTRLVSLNVQTSQVSQIAQANYFSATAVAANKVFYKEADAYDEDHKSSLTGFDITTGARQEYMRRKEINYITTPRYGVVELQLQDGQNMELIAATGATQPISRQPDTNREFTLSQDASRVLWVEPREGRGALIVRHLGTGEEAVAVRIGGMTGPVRMVNASLAVVRVVTSSETADYVVHLASGKFAKIANVSNIGSFGL